MSGIQTSLLSNTIKLYHKHTRNAGTSPAKTLPPGASEPCRVFQQGKNNKTGKDYTGLSCENKQGSLAKPQVVKQKHIR